MLLLLLQQQQQSVPAAALPAVAITVPRSLSLN
jgi:hypothetical protein